MGGSRSSFPIFYDILRSLRKYPVYQRCHGRDRAGGRPSHSSAKASLVSDHEEELRRTRQQRALTVRGKGALIETEYHSRTSKVVPVNENDLRDLLGMDAAEATLTWGGNFFASGALWLFLSKYSEPDFQWSAVEGFSAAAFCFGILLALVGFGIRLMKRNRIKRIFAETKPVRR